jgi:general secretion pathway protein C
MTLGSANLSQIWLQISKYQSQLNLLLVVLLALYLLAFVADMTWRLFPSPELNQQSASQANKVSGNKISNGDRINLSQLKSLNLFGDLTTAPVDTVKQEITDAPETRLNLTLTGVVATNVPSVAAAIIENRGMQNTYGIDDEIDGTNATLYQVYADRVIIQNGPSRETLMLDGVEYSTERQTYQPPEQIVSSGEEITAEQQISLSPEVARSTRELQRSPAGFTDFITITPHTQDGQLAGYRISAGKKPNLFKGAGFVAGDIVIEINGLDLTDPQQALEAMSALREADSLQLTINRGEELLTLYLDFPEGEDEQDI